MRPSSRGQSGSPRPRAMEERSSSTTPLASVPPPTGRSPKNCSNAKNEASPSPARHSESNAPCVPATSESKFAACQRCLTCGIDKQMKIFAVYAGVMQGVLFCVMAFLLPWIMRASPKALTRYAIYSAFLWFAYTLVATAVDIALDCGVPGIGYLGMGFVAWILGYAIISSYNPPTDRSSSSDPNPPSP